ncbi:hypothetical protein F4777DRAFT_310657 [Nemania sp. FL0916]|nr:hypothetical protein F4777DRAFT_310657 [Nemania sp. FL0916]
MAPPRLKKAKKNQQAKKLVDADDYLASGDSNEEAMRKHRVGDPVKALRFADRALEDYSQGIAKFPRSFDLAYNRARLLLEKGTDPVLSRALSVPVMNVLEEALSSHHYARDLEPENTDALFNLAQVLTSMAETIAEDDEPNSFRACQLIKQALEAQSRCFNLQQSAFAKNRLELERAMRESAQLQSEQVDSERDGINLASESRDTNQEEQWVRIEEPITATTLLETITAQVEALSALCSILSSSLASPPSLDESLATSLSWIDAYSTSLLTETLPALINENREVLEPRLSDVILPKAVFISNYLELSFRSSTIDAEKYKTELDAAFSQPGLDPASEDVLMASVRALLSFNSALADLEQPNGAAAAINHHAELRWNILVEARRRLTSVSNIPDIDKHTAAETHLMRGDVSLLMQILAYPPWSYSQALATTPQLLKHAEVYYRNASRLVASVGLFDQAADEDKIVCEFKGAMVSVLQQVTTDHATTSTSSSSDNSGAIIAVPASADLLERALGPFVKTQGGQWVRDNIEDMITEGMVAPAVFSALAQG